MSRVSWILVAGLAMGLLTAAPVLAATFVVNSTADAVDVSPGNGECKTAGGECTLRAAIQEANALRAPEGITITLPAGTYTFTLAGTEEDASATGDLDVFSAIVINGADASTTIIDANLLGRVFEVHAGGLLTLNDVTVQNGRAELLTYRDSLRHVGGGLLGGPGSTLTLTRVVVKNNSALSGGAGGGIGLAALDGSRVVCMVVDSTITQNVAVRTGETTGDGGGIWAVDSVTLTITRSTISSNTASHGGGMSFFASVFLGAGPTTTITGSTISGNSADTTGGGISTTGRTTIANSTISGNSALRSGGALYYYGGRAGGSKLVNVTIASNSTGRGGAVELVSCFSCGPLAFPVQNTIIANNFGAVGTNCIWNIAAYHSVLIDDGNNLEFPGTTCGFDRPSDVRADPLLGLLVSNGGSTQTRALNPGSPAINAANDDACAGSLVGSIDQRGIARPFEAHCDIGAFELTTPPHADLAFDFGAAGLWALYNTYAQLHAANPGAMATGDLDGNGKADLIVDFSGSGVWVWSNDAGWFQLHTVDAASIATGDLDGNGLDEVLLDFPGFGIWVRVNNNGWFQLHAASPIRMVTADLDGNGKAEAIIDFPGSGIWVWKNNTSWSQLHPANAAAIVAGDFDGGGRTDLLLDFSGAGLWVWSNNTSWFQLHTADATVMTTGDLDGNGKADAIISFPGFGIWAWMNSAGFVQLHASNAALMTAADIDGSGRDDVIISFAGFGVWAWMNHATWQQLHTQNPEGIAAGNLDGN